MESYKRSSWKAKKNNTSKCQINKEGQIITESKEISDCFNEYFVGVGPTQASKINSNDTDYFQYPANPCDDSFFFVPTDCVEVLNIVKALKISYSSTHDEMSTHFF